MCWNTSRQYATILSYLHYCQGMVNRDLPLSVMRTLLLEDRDGEEDFEIEKVREISARHCIFGRFACIL